MIGSCVSLPKHNVRRSQSCDTVVLRYWKTDNVIRQREAAVGPTRGLHSLPRAPQTGSCPDASQG